MKLSQNALDSMRELQMIQKVFGEALPDAEPVSNGRVLRRSRRTSADALASILIQPGRVKSPQATCSFKFLRFRSSRTFARSRSDRRPRATLSAV